MKRRSFLALSGFAATTAAVGATASRVGAVPSAQAGGVRVLFEGDSLTYGYCGATGGGLGSLPPLAQLLTTAGYPAAVGLSVPPENGKGSIDGRWKPNTWSLDKVSGESWGGDGAAYRTSHPLGSLTYTPGTACDTFDVYWIGDSTGGQLSLAIDGGQPLQVSTESSSGMIGRTTIQASSVSTSHVLSMGGTGSLIVAGVEPYVSSDSTTVLLANGGVDGAQTVWWVRNNLPGEGPQDCVAAYGADIVVISLGGDDLAGNVPLATYLANMATLASNAQSDGASVIVSTMEPVNPALGYGTAMQQWNAALVEWAQGASIPVVDLYTYFNNAGDYKTLNGAPYHYYYSDGVHLTAAGYAFRAGAFVGALQTAISALP